MLTIRPETAADHGAIADVVDTAFRTAPHSGGNEARIVAALRAADALTLSLVAQGEGRILGHVAASSAEVGGEAGWALIGPLAVLPDRQRQGVGSALMRAALGQLRGAFRGVVLVGDPAYYGRFGFRALPGLTLSGVPDEAVQALVFHGRPPQGEIAHHAAFGIAP
ncbi:MAG: N-acetyltransferase [Rhodobacteraceae bacterium]|nr:N-acetyltransferase [Paracoccaceae bacterium]